MRENTDMLRSLIALDYIYELQKILEKLQEQVESLGRKATKLW